MVKERNVSFKKIGKSPSFMERAEKRRNKSFPRSPGVEKTFFQEK